MFIRDDPSVPEYKWGKPYLFDYNRPNNLSVNLNRRIGNNLNLNLVWIYQSGLPFTEAIGRQYIPSVTTDDRR